MATIGVSRNYFAKYTNEGTTVTYSEGDNIGKSTEVDISINSSEDNNLYADNGVAETATTFTGGTLTIKPDDLPQSIAKIILGVKEQAIEGIDGVTDSDAKELIYDDDQTAPSLGYGTIIKKRVNSVTMWRAVVLTKIMFAVPKDAATTQKETIEWQVPELTATIMRDDTAKHAWKREATFTTEAQADAYIKHLLNITA